jgi:phosphohistidine phosphatase
MAAEGHLPALVLCSPALRTRQTHECAGAAGGLRGEVRIVDALYDTGAAEYLDVLRAADADSILIVGHNPSMEEFGDALAGDGDPQAMASLKRGFPVCGLATLDFDRPFASAAPGAGTLLSFRVFEG